MQESQVTKAGKACVFRHNLANVDYQKSSEKEGNPWDNPVNTDNYWCASTLSLRVCEHKCISSVQIVHNNFIEFSTEREQNIFIFQVRGLTWYICSNRKAELPSCQHVSWSLKLAEQTTAEASTSIYLSACEDVSCQFHFCKVPLADCFQQSVVSDVRLFICTGSYWVSTPSSRAPGAGGDFLPPISMWSVLQGNKHRDKEVRGHAVLHLLQETEHECLLSLQS